MHNLLLRNNLQIAIYCVALLPTFASVHVVTFSFKLGPKASNRGFVFSWRLIYLVLNYVFLNRCS